MNVYDFDKTIYDGDSTLDFYFFCLNKHPSIIRFLPKQITGAVLYKLGIYSKLKFKEMFYSFLKGLDNTDYLVESFWNHNKSKIMPWYLNQKKPTDVVISASPEFILKPVCDKLKIKSLIASKVNKEDGKTLSENCYGEQKVIRFKEIYDVNDIENFYTDSKSDIYMARLAKKAFIIKNKEIIEWNV